MNNVDRSSVIALSYVHDVLISDCAFLNVGSQGWGIRLGTSESMIHAKDGGCSSCQTDVVNRNVTVRDCKFDGLAGTLEQLLITNSEVPSV